ncbi:ion channel [Cellulosimicrobium cellulans]|uniref:ion channel n=1 Tax=Cellulosimicrobium cellulans TaxID=1710 RepID=UPI00084919CC|nr:ion channel [Cellulosimicrobium cellulans]
MDVVLTVAGVAVIVLVLRDVFHTLWHPAGEGRLNGLVGRGIWGAVHRLPAGSGRRRLLMDLAGPLTLAVVVTLWAVGVVVGWGLVFLPHMPSAFQDTTGSPPVTAWERVVSSVYVSIVGLSTLGIGDIVPTAPWTRLWTAVQALVGFALLSASMSWIVQVTPALTRRRALARRLTALAAADGRSGDDGGHATDVPVRTVEDLVQELAAVHVQLRQYGETYYFRDSVTEEALPVAIGAAVALAEDAQRSDDPEVRRSGASLGWTLDGFAALLDETYLHTGGSTSEVFAAYAADQDHEAPYDARRPSGRGRA